MQTNDTKTIEWTHGNTRHNWDKWFDGSVQKKKAGVHFFCTPESFRSQVCTAAQKRGLRVKTKVVENTVIFAVVPSSKGKKKQ